VDLNYSTNLIFPVPIHQFDVNGFSEIQSDLIDYAYKLREKDPVGNKKSNEGGWQSFDFDINNSDDILHNILINCTNKFPVFKKNVYALVHAWVNINKTGDYNEKHLHPNCNLAGVLWIKAPKDCGNIVFDSPVQFQTNREVNSYCDNFKKENNIFNAYYFKPTEGRVLIFPSYLAHNVKKNLSQEDRISVSFNIRLQMASQESHI
tara:strand:+ start:107 stop:724 length:618 start_codon:yes stop_codon:yes gene_type:complete